MPSPGTSRFSYWWPISFFILFAITLIIGIALSVKYGSSSYNSCYHDYRHNRVSYDDDSCVTKNSGLLYGAVVCFIIAGVSKLIGWILVLIWCLRRRRTAQTYEQKQPFLTPQPYGHPDHGIPFTQYPGAQYPAPQQPAPFHAPPGPGYQPPPMAASPPLK